MAGRDFVESRVVIPSPEVRRRICDAAEEVGNDGGGRSVLSAARPDHQPTARAGAAAERIDWDWLDGEIASLYSDKGRPGIESRFVVGLLLLKQGFCQKPAASR